MFSALSFSRLVRPLFCNLRKTTAVAAAIRPRFFNLRKMTAVATSATAQPRRLWLPGTRLLGWCIIGATAVRHSYTMTQANMVKCEPAQAKTVSAPNGRRPPDEPPSSWTRWSLIATILLGAALIFVLLYPSQFPKLKETVEVFLTQIVNLALKPLAAALLAFSVSGPLQDAASFAHTGVDKPDNDSTKSSGTGGSTTPEANEASTTTTNKTKAESLPTEIPVNIYCHAFNTVLRASPLTREGQFKNHGVLDLQDAPGPWEKFELLPTGVPGRYYIYSLAHAAYVYAADRYDDVKNPPPMVKKCEPENWESFELIPAGEGLYYIKSYHNTYLSGASDKGVKMSLSRHEQNRGSVWTFKKASP